MLKLNLETALKESAANPDVEVAAKPKPFFGTVKGKSYAVFIEGADNARVGRDFDTDRQVFKFMTGKVPGVKKGYVSAKGKATLPAAKAWVKDNKPSQFAAKWGADSSSYKDDSFVIYYKP